MKKKKSGLGIDLENVLEADRLSYMDEELQFIVDNFDHHPEFAD